jgi:putative protease
MQLVLTEKGAELTFCCGAHTLRSSVPGPLPRAERAADAALRTALGKTGGTPFYASSINVQTNGFFLPATAANKRRRQLLAELLVLRETPTPIAVSPAKSLPKAAAPKNAWPTIAAQRKAKETAGKPLLRARFACVAQMPHNAADICVELLVPLHEARQVPQAIRGKTILCLPRAVFGPEEQRTAGAIKDAKGQGFAGYYAQNMAHLWLCRGLPLYAGFGLNAANIASVGELAFQGCGSITLSPELSLTQTRAITQTLQAETAPLADALCYGHLPLMLTRACPIKQAVKSCAECNAQGYLTDRKGEHFKVTCQNGAREIYNPIPLWMADRLTELPTHTATLWFTTETAEEAADVLKAFAQGQKAPASFTRGLFDKGVALPKKQT